MVKWCARTIAVEEEDLAGWISELGRGGGDGMNGGHTSNLSMKALMPSLSPVRYCGAEDMSVGGGMNLGRVGFEGEIQL